MNILSFLATVTCVLFIVVSVRRLTSIKINAINVFAMLVCCTLSWWAFCDAFFYVAPTKEAAWFWHQAGAIGWCGFIGMTAYFFLMMTGFDRRMSLFSKILYWGGCVALTLRFVLKHPTALAVDLVQSGSGLGWALVVDYQSIWLYLYLAYLTVYLGGALLYLVWWLRKRPERTVRYLSLGFVILDVVSVTVGAISILVLPYFTNYFPPMGFIATMIFLMGYRYLLWEYDLQNIELALNPKDIFENSLEAMVITDRKFQIAYANQSSLPLLKADRLEGHFFETYFQEESRETLKKLQSATISRIQSIQLTLMDGTPVIASGNRVNTRRGHVPLLVFSLHDISQLRQAQNQMEYMAHYDELTGLANRRRFGELLDQWDQRAQEEAFDFALLFMDLNHFKSINDRYGHAAGDEALVAVASAIRENLQQGDAAARLSGDEFVVLHRMSESQTVDEVIARWRQLIQAVDSRSFAPDIAMDAAIGACLHSESSHVRQQLKIADQRMYEMKQQCGDCD